MPSNPSVLPRLASLDPQEITREVHAAVEAKARELGALLGVPVAMSGPSDVAARVAELVAFAREGRRDMHLAGEGALRQIERALYGRAVDGPMGDRGTCIRCRAALLGVSAHVRVAIAAARARLAIEDCQGVAVVDLAALAGVNPRWLNQLAARGQLERYDDGTITPASARAWLTGRVPGFETAPSLVRTRGRRGAGPLSGSAPAGRRRTRRPTAQ